MMYYLVQIYKRFVNTNQEYIFLELLEKYILCDGIYYIPAIIMQGFISIFVKNKSFNGCRKISIAFRSKTIGY